MSEPALQQLLMLCCTEKMTTVVSWCFCTAAHELSMHLLHIQNHNKLWSHNSLAMKCNSHALSHEVAAHVVTIQMQLCVCEGGFFVAPPRPTHWVWLSTPHLWTSLPMTKHQQIPSSALPRAPKLLGRHTRPNRRICSALRANVLAWRNGSLCEANVLSSLRCLPKLAQKWATFKVPHWTRGWQSISYRFLWQTSQRYWPQKQPLHQTPQSLLSAIYIQPV